MLSNTVIISPVQLLCNWSHKVDHVSSGHLLTSLTMESVRVGVVGAGVVGLTSALKLQQQIEGVQVCFNHSA